MNACISSRIRAKGNETIYIFFSLLWRISQQAAARISFRILLVSRNSRPPFLKHIQPSKAGNRPKKKRKDAQLILWSVRKYGSKLAGLSVFTNRDFRTPQTRRRHIHDKMKIYGVRYAGFISLYIKNERLETFPVRKKPKHRRAKFFYKCIVLELTEWEH